MSDTNPPTSVPAVPGKRQKDRSPGYPSIGLRKALLLAQKLWEHDNRQSVLATRAASNLGFSAKSSGGLLALAAMKKYGILQDEGSGEARKVKLTESAISMLNPSHPQRAQLIKEAALKPGIYAELWAKYGPHSASDGTISDFLTFEKKFFAPAAKSLIETYKDTVEFACLKESDKEEEGVTLHVEQMPNPALDIYEAQEAKRAVQDAKHAFETPHEGRPIPRKHPYVTLNELPIPLDGGLVARVPFPMTEDTFDLLLGTLQLWKKKLIRTDYPKSAIWKNKDHDMPVLITGVAGEQNGVTYFQSSTGTGIPSNELEFQ